MSDRNIKIESRNEHFSSRIQSKITCEKPSEDNEFLAEETRIHGYDVLDLMDNCDYLDTFYLLFRGELPTKAQKTLLQKLSVAIINLGPRHQSSRAAANAGIGRTDVNNILPIAIMAMSGSYGGSKEIENAMRFLKKSFKLLPKVIASEQLYSFPITLDEDWIVAPGFGTDFQGQSPYLINIVNKLSGVSPVNGYLNWAVNFVDSLPVNKNCGWRLAGLVASVLLDLNFEPREGGGVFQLLAGPGSFAHGIEFSNKPITDMPFLKDEDYIIKNG